MQGLHLRLQNEGNLIISLPCHTDAFQRLRFSFPKLLFQKLFLVIDILTLFLSLRCGVGTAFHE
jgi:hypothetical protein